ncbi:uncharacterized protein CLUP02_15340 [Colletotrichum lupini]|uniref:Uncharacterized protein n=1 Tax=Colletotrichum lupini TaxID=145971 RepID=A0A9Q8T5V7_9PEZI|nr:uncharacterized protein CLUP02_15340 [Colletotrichum lupini]UQC89809.1 hypothetical protein CLUP02_15340 [Colletotrichum lupini]
MSIGELNARDIGYQAVFNKAGEPVGGIPEAGSQLSQPRSICHSNVMFSSVLELSAVKQGLAGSERRDEQLRSPPDRPAKSGSWNDSLKWFFLGDGLQGTTTTKSWHWMTIDIGAMRCVLEALELTLGARIQGNGNPDAALKLVEPPLFAATATIVKPRGIVSQLRDAEWDENAANEFLQLRKIPLFGDIALRSSSHIRASPIAVPNCPLPRREIKRCIALHCRDVTLSIPLQGRMAQTDSLAKGYPQRCAIMPFKQHRTTRERDGGGATTMT